MQIVVEERGSGPRTLVCLHGLGASRDHFYEVSDALDGRFRCVLPDLRGHGDSPPGPVESLDDLLEDVRPLVRAAAPVFLCGLSLGADLARLLWAAEPQAVAGVALVDPLLDADVLWRWARKGVSSEREAYRRVIGPFLEHDLERLVALMADYPLTADLDEEARRRNARSHLRADHETLHAILRVLGRPLRLPGRPRGSRARAVLLRARRSPACPRWNAIRLAVRLRARLATIETGHCASLSAPHELADALERFLD